MKLRSKRGESESAESSGAKASSPLLSPSTRRLADQLLRHYAEASGVGVKHFRASSRAAVAACLDGMEGEDAAKEARLRAVIDDAIAESRARGREHPSLSFVFHARHVRRRLERLAEAEHLARKAAEAGGGDMFAAGFDGALAEARAELAAGVEATALERARPFVDNRLVTDASRLAAFHKLGAASRRGRGSPPLAKAARPASRTAQDAPQRGLRPLGSAAAHGSSGAVSGPEDALRALTALFGPVDVPPPPRPVPTVPLTDAERAELEAARDGARARWARAG